MNPLARTQPGLQALIPPLLLLITLGAGCSEKEATAPEESAAQSAPAMQRDRAETQTAVQAPAPAAEPAEPQSAARSMSADSSAQTQPAAVDGQKIYQASCQACHAAGVAGAPKAGDRDAWAPRIAKGQDALFASVKNGLNAMPPKGACMGCSDAELRAAIAYLVEQSS
jgi:cytochrome c5